MRGYEPATVRVKAGAPVRLVFDRQETSGWSEEVVFPDFGVRKFLPAHRRTTVNATVSYDPTAVSPDALAEAEVAGCGCGAHGADGRRAVAVDPDARTRNLKRLRRIEGQVRGLQKMIEEDRYCADVMTQISSVHEALRAVGRELMRNHLEHCATTAIRAGEAEANAMYDELVDLMHRHSR